VLHLLFLAGVVAFAHHPAVFMGLLLFFLGFAKAYPQFQDRLILREGLLVAFFLAGLVVILAGYMALSEKTVTGFLPLTLAPILLVLGYCVIIPVGIMYRKKTRADEPSHPSAG